MDPIDSTSNMQVLAKQATSALEYALEPVAKGVEFAQSLARVAGNDAILGGGTDSLLQQQFELQKEMLKVTLISNVERTRHETEMTPARNLRLS